jgi:hypothetical protein
MQRHAQPEVGIVIEVRAGADDPVDESGLDQRDDAGATDAGGVSAPGG